jgi:fumarate reductase flavoprotein subunit
VVAGMIVGEFMADFCDSADSEISVSTGQAKEFWRREGAQIDALLDGDGDESSVEILAAMQNIMTDKVGIFRNGENLQLAVDELQALLLRSRNIGVSTKARGANPELVAAYRVRRMLKLAICTAYGALQRTESRGAHFREDHTQRNDQEWLKRTLATWENDSALLPTLNYEPLDVMRMELPPGHRGYGGADHIDHPDTQRRQAEVEAIRDKVTDADRFALQDALMPYEELLPVALRGRNERLGENE